MQKFLLTLLLALVIPFAGSAFDLKDLKNALGGMKSDSTENATSGSGAGSILGGLISGLISQDKLSVNDIVGSWSYSAPAVSFRSENFLKKAGGEAAAAAVEKKLEPYYRTTGLNNLTLVVNEDSTFTIKVRTIVLKGKVEQISDKDSDYNFTLRFTALGKINLGSIDVYVRKSGNSKMDMMFDVSKLISIAQAVSKVMNNSTINAAVSVLNSYDGICAGFTLVKK